MEPNVPLFQKLMDHLTTHPEEHDQGVWGRAKVKDGTPCGTAFCAAGTVVSWSEKYKLVWEQYDSRNLELNCAVPIDVTAPEIVSDLEDLPRESVLISVAAQRELGIDSTTLFAGNNTLHDLWYLSNKLCNGQLTVPPEFQGVPPSRGGELGW